MSCPVCFGGEDNVVRESLNAGIGVLLGVTGLVLGGFASFFITIAHRARGTGFVANPEPGTRNPEQGNSPHA